MATGETGRELKIYVWDALSMQIKQKMQARLSKGVKSLAFSPSGTSLLAIDIS